MVERECLERSNCGREMNVWREVTVVERECLERSNCGRERMFGEK